MSKAALRARESQERVLDALRERGAGTASFLARVTRLSERQAGKALRQLRREGLVAFDEETEWWDLTP